MPKYLIEQFRHNKFIEKSRSSQGGKSKKAGEGIRLGQPQKNRAEIINDFGPVNFMNKNRKTFKNSAKLDEDTLLRCHYAESPRMAPLQKTVLNQ
jgi:hypothetical protein